MSPLASTNSRKACMVGKRVPSAKVLILSALARRSGEDVNPTGDSRKGADVAIDRLRNCKASWTPLGIYGHGIASVSCKRLRSNCATGVEIGDGDVNAALWATLMEFEHERLTLGGVRTRSKRRCGAARKPRVSLGIARA